jgi:hypothetical protein
VARSPRSEAYRARHLFSPAREPGGMVRAPLGRRARQRLCYGRLLGLLGFAGEARSQLAEAEGEARDDHALRAEIARVAQELPTETMAP